MKKLVLFGATFALLAVGACTSTSVQPMSKDTFKVATDAAPACGSAGARNVAFTAAAIEVIRKGGDKFIILGDNTDTGLTGNIFSGTLMNNYSQGMVVKMVAEGSAEAVNALSARETLGADWQTVVAEGVPNTCA